MEILKDMGGDLDIRYDCNLQAKGAFLDSLASKLNGSALGLRAKWHIRFPTGIDQNRDVTACLNVF